MQSYRSSPETEYDSEEDGDDDDPDADIESKYSSPSSSPPNPQVRLNGNSRFVASGSRRSNGRRRLKQGDNIFWHNLTRVGELPGINPHEAPDLEDPMVRLRRKLKCLR